MTVRVRLCHVASVLIVRALIIVIRANRLCNVRTTMTTFLCVPLALCHGDICTTMYRDAEFCKVDQGTLFELILAANYMDIKPLLDLTCKTVANMIKGKALGCVLPSSCDRGRVIHAASFTTPGKTPEEIRKTFNIVNDFTPEGIAVSLCLSCALAHSKCCFPHIAEEEQVRRENEWCEDR